jgi:hypothetical protein
VPAKLHLSTDQIIPVSTEAKVKGHMDADLHISLDGHAIAIPANVGESDSGHSDSASHDDGGHITIDSKDQPDVTLQDLLAMLKAQDSAALAALNAATHITVTVNGTISTDLTKLQDHDTIVINAVSANPPSAGNALFVTKLYTDLLHRAPDETGLVEMITALDAGMSRTQAALTIEASPEFHALEVQNLYRTFLHREAEPGGLATFTAFLAAGGTQEQVTDIILASPEYLQDAGGTNAGFVAALYHDILHRPADAAGAASWQAGLLAGMTRDQVADAILHSPEADALTVQEFFQAYLHRPADPQGLATFGGLLQSGGTSDQVRADILGSPEYFNESHP